MEQKAVIRERKTKWSNLCDFYFFIIRFFGIGCGFHVWKWTTKANNTSDIVKRNRSYNFCCIIKLNLLHTKSMLKEKSQNIVVYCR